MRYYFSEKRSGNETLIAICDEDILGKTFRSPPFFLEVKQDFYKGELIEESELSVLFRRATMLNLSGKNIVTIAKNRGLVKPERIMKIGTTLHAQMVRL